MATVRGQHDLRSLVVRRVHVARLQRGEEALLRKRRAGRNEYTCPVRVAGASVRAVVILVSAERDVISRIRSDPGSPSRARSVRRQRTKPARSEMTTDDVW